MGIFKKALLLISHGENYQKNIPQIIN